MAETRLACTTTGSSTCSATSTCSGEVRVVSSSDHHEESSSRVSSSLRVEAAPSAHHHHHHHHYYCCVECLTPTPTLYKLYLTHASVKLTRCANCGNDVDPFVEREALLVSFDLILHRIAAYRHALFNRDPFAEFDVSTSVARSLKFALGTSILDAYIKYEALRFRLYYDTATNQRGGGRGSESAVDDSDDDPSMFINLLAMSFVELMLMLIGTILIATPLLDVSMRSYYVSRLSLAVVVPSVFKSIVIFVHIWENSPTTRMLGALFVASMQWMAVHTVVERLVTSIGGGGKSRKTATALHRICMSVPGSPLLGGWLLRICIPIFIATLLDMDDKLLQCSGAHLPAFEGFNLASSERNVRFCVL
mmetsp:Transcript_16261/g.35362  ORF Transcript_16261/g.35362 Transcript_16261/m.35362 type:complete len:364 (-) Transcript_16261:1767-2858(-)